VLLSWAFLLFNFTVADAEEMDEISEDELPGCSCKCGGVEKLLHFPALARKEIFTLLILKVYNRAAKFEIFISDCMSETTSFKPWTCTIR
jgi:hypothetical protein